MFLLSGNPNITDHQNRSNFQDLNPFLPECQIQGHFIRVRSRRPRGGFCTKLEIMRRMTRIYCRGEWGVKVCSEWLITITLPASEKGVIFQYIGNIQESGHLLPAVGKTNCVTLLASLLFKLICLLCRGKHFYLLLEKSWFYFLMEIIVTG